MMSDYNDRPAWWGDPAAPQERALEQIVEQLVVLFDHPDALEQLMRWQAGTSAILVSRDRGAVAHSAKFVNATTMQRPR